MGLDMYLYAEKYLSGKDWDPKDQATNKKVRKLLPDMFLSGNLDVVLVKFETAYWRKSNQIHQWFVDNCQDGVDDCKEYYVGREQIEQLIELCKTAVANKDMAPSALPTQDGFFFGGTEYDEWYYKDLEATVEMLGKCLGLPDVWQFTYRSSW